jgi:hypothetical protein
MRADARRVRADARPVLRQIACGVVLSLALLPAAAPGCALGVATIAAVIDCTAKDLAGLEPVANALVGRLAGAPDETWSAVTTDLEKAGATIGGCVAADLLDVATSGSGSSGSGAKLSVAWGETYTDPVDVARCEGMLATIKTSLKISAVIKTRRGVH